MLFIYCILFMSFFSIVETSPNKKRAAIFGGGPSGLTAALELAEAGFQVDLYEKTRRFGGKMVGIVKKKLPWEHSIRLYSMKYLCLGDVFERIGLQPPTQNNLKSPSFTQLEDALIGTKKSGLLPSKYGFFPKIIELGFFPGEVSYFLFQVNAYKLLNGDQVNALFDTQFDTFINGFAFEQYQAFTNCTVGTDTPQVYCKPGHSQAFNDFIYSQVAALGASNRVSPPPVVLAIFEVFFRSLLPPSPTICEPYDKTYFSESFYAAGPTSPTLINPWVRYLKNLNVNLYTNSELLKLKVDKNPSKKIVTKATVREDGEKFEVDADVFIMAIPVRDAELVKAGITKGNSVSTLWSFSFQFYIPCLPENYSELYFNRTRSTLIYDSELAPIFLYQSPKDGMWAGANFKLKRKYDYSLSVVISESSKAQLNTFLKTTRSELLAQLLKDMLFPESVTCPKRSLTYTHADLIREAKNGMYLLDIPDKKYQHMKTRKFKTASVGPIKSDGNRWVLKTPVFLPTPSTKPVSPITSYKNLFLAGDYVSVPLVPAVSMEHAAEAGKLAAQAAVEVALAGGPLADFKVPRVKMLLDLVNVTSVHEYDVGIRAKGARVGPCT